ncbi:MAG: hypothetical protein ABL956_03430 [Hyphomonadaceae bacterium]
MTAGDVLTAPKTVEHGIPPYLTCDEALILILDRYPDALFDINCHDFDGDDEVSLTTGTRSRADGRTVLNAIKAGRLWGNLRSCEEAHPGLWAQDQRAFSQRARQLCSAGARKMTGQLILSCPNTRVPFHFDAAGVVLFHLRGVKAHVGLPEHRSFPAAGWHGKGDHARDHGRADLTATSWTAPPGASTWSPAKPSHGHSMRPTASRIGKRSASPSPWTTRPGAPASPRAPTASAAAGAKRLSRWQKTGWAERTLLWAGSLAFARLNLMKNNIMDFERTFDVAGTAVVVYGEREAA